VAFPPKPTSSKYIAANLDSDLAYIFSETGVKREWQYRIALAVFRTVQRFADLEETRALVREALRLDLGLHAVVGTPAEARAHQPRRRLEDSTRAPGTDHGAPRLPACLVRRARSCTPSRGARKGKGAWTVEQNCSKWPRQDRKGEGDRKGDRKRKRNRKSKGDRKGDRKQGGKSNRLESRTADGRLICFRYYDANASCTGACGFLHVCRITGCGGTHPMHVCPTLAPPGG
jgi:hypothetical protein